MFEMRLTDLIFKNILRRVSVILLKKNIQTETFCVKTVLKHVDVFFPGKTCIFRLQKTSLFAFCPLLFALCYTLNALCVS